MRNQCHTIIIGAGPCGLTAGRYLDDALILDGKEKIGKPVRCGEGISVEALERMDISPSRDWICCGFKVLQRIMPNGKATGKKGNKFKGYVIDRVKFEKYLASLCKAEIKLKSEVIDLWREDDFWNIKTDDGKIYKGKYLIGADGHTSIAARKIFNQKIKLKPALQYLVCVDKNLETDNVQIFLGNRIAIDGYIWIFPKSINTANIGIISRGNTKQLLDNFLINYLKSNYGGYKILENKSGAIPMGGVLPIIQKDNAMLAGDAARLNDPIFDGGMSQAMYSAKIAAECINNNEVDQYEKKIKSLPFVKFDLLEARENLYSWDDETLNELGEVLNNRGSSYLKTIPGMIKLFSKPHLRARSKDIIRFFRIWRKVKEWVW